MNSVRYFVYGNIWIAFSITCFVACTYVGSTIPIDYAYLILCFGASLFTYNFQRIIKKADLAKAEDERGIWLYNHIKELKYLSIIGIVICACVVYFVSFEAILSLVLLSLISLLYAGNFLKGQSLRDIPQLKIYLIAFSWAITAVIPYLTLNTLISYSDWFMLITEKFLFIVALTIPFDIRDLHIDDNEKKTLAQILGVKQAKTLAVILLCVALFLVDYLDLQILPYLITYTIVAALILLQKKERNEMYYSFILDGIPVLLLLGLLLGKNLV